MLKSITRFLVGQLSSEAGGHTEDALRLAAAALTAEALRADDQVGAVEREAALRALAGFYCLDAEATDELLRLGEQKADEGTSLFQFTHAIDREYSREDKVRLVELLWQVAYADGHKDAREEHLVRKVADLLHVPHRDFIRARLRVEEALATRPQD